MRMRHKKHSAERIAACSSLLISDPETALKAPETIFSVNRPIHLEIGCGKGDFAVGMAIKHPEYNWIAVERVQDVTCIALEKAMVQRESHPDNLRFLIANAQNLADWLPPHSVDCIYLNFSDPWPKYGYRKRRLTHENFLSLYRTWLVPGGLLKCKTDNVGLFDFSLEELEKCGWRIEWQTRDLHASEKAIDNIMTEYERNFSAKGQAICSVWARVPDKEIPMNFEELVRKNRSYRSFDRSCPVTKERLLGWIDLARLTPSSRNLQMMKFRMVTSESEQAALLSLTRWAGALPELHLPPIGQEPTAYAVICADQTIIQNAESFEKDAGILAQTLLLAAANDGFGGCMIGNFSPVEVKTCLHLPEHLTPVLVVALGKPDEKVVLTDLPADGSCKYYRADGIHYVPKRALADLVIDDGV